MSSPNNVHPASTPQPDPSAEGLTSRIRLATDLLTVGEFRLPAHHPLWSQENRISSERPLIVFPRVPVIIRHTDKAPVVADPNTIMFYNPGQTHTRQAISDRGDACEFFAIAPHALAAAQARNDPSAEDRAGRFTAPSGPSTSHVYRAQRRLFEYACTPDADPLVIEESFLLLLPSALDPHARPSRPNRRGDTRRAHADAAHEARRFLGRRFQERLRISEVARAAHLSEFHFCRVFREHTGYSVSRYIAHLRLRTSLELLRDPKIPLAEIAASLGFCSQAHFTTAFRSVFGLTPGAARAEGLPRHASRLVKDMFPLAG